MKMQDEDLQKRIENGLADEESKDARAYRRVFEVLKKEPDFHVSLSFADRLIALIDKREEKRDFWWMGLGIFLSIIAMIVAIALSTPDLSTNAFKFLSGYKGLVIFGIAFILLLHWIDRNVIRKKIVL